MIGQWPTRKKAKPAGREPRRQDAHRDLGYYQAGAPIGAPIQSVGRLRIICNASVEPSAMRSVLVLGLLAILCASADAATVHHSRARRVFVAPRQDLTAPEQRVTPSASFAVPGWTEEQTLQWLERTSAPGRYAG